MSPAPGDRRIAHRLVALAIGTCLALVLASAALRFSSHVEAAPRIDRAAIARLLEKRAETPAERATPASTSTSSCSSERRPEDRRWFVPEADAATIFCVATRGQRYDPWSYYSHRPNLREVVPWTEHPRGEWIYSTNSAGFRMDAEVRRERPDLRVLLTGDSHTEGYCDNRDSFAALTERALADRRPGSTVEVVNAADGGYSFHNYLGVLEEHLDLRPHVFVFTVHGGNDFKEVLLPWRYFAHRPVPADSPGEVERRNATEHACPPALFQGLASIEWFTNHPDDVDVALDASLELVREMQRICATNGIAILCVYLPSPLEIESRRCADEIEPAERAAGITADDVARHARIGSRFRAALATSGIEVLDATPLFAASDRACYWKRDLHLSLDGHAIVARALTPLLERALHRAE